MPSFSKISQQRLNTVDPRLRAVIVEVIKLYDFSVICGHRGKEKQDAAVAAGMSKVNYPDSKHNTVPSKAIDIAPYPIDWNDRERFVYLAGMVKGVAHCRGLKVRWGGDFNQDGDLHNQSFIDLPHFEV